MQKIFYVYEKNKNKEVNYVFVKKGFDIKACIFNLFWFIYNKIWYAFFATLLIYFLLEVFVKINIIDNNEKTILLFCFYLIIGFSASDIRIYFLKKNGYKETCTLLENNITCAKISFYSQKDV